MTKYQSKEFAMDMSNLNPKISDCELAMDCTIPMGITSETVAERYNISRTKQDQLAVLSHSKYVIYIEMYKSVVIYVY